MTLRARLTLTLLLLFLAVGATLYVGIARGAGLYFEEVHYKLNRDVAEHIAKTLEPFDEVGDIDKQALSGLFMDVMTINPSLEVYLIDTDGEVLAYDAPPGHVKRESIDLAPLRAALANPGEAGDLRGTDPRSLERDKPFSAAELRSHGELQGYLYVILGGEAHEAVAASLRESNRLRGLLLFLLGSVVLSAVVGAVCIAFLVRPLRRLRDSMVGFQEGERPSGLEVGADEVGELSSTFQAMADRIAEQLEELRQNDQRRREFVANVSHDLRTPTGAIQGYLETLTLRWERLDPGEREQFLQIALRQAERLGKLVDQLFELTRIEAREFTPRLEVFSIGELVQDVVAKFQAGAAKKSIRLHATIGYDVPPVRADIGLLERVLDNLLDNAIRYTQPGGTVRVELQQAAGGVGLSVADSGPGIPDEDVPRLFDRFYRVERPTSEKVRGTGLGLAITKRIVELHRGTIEVESSSDAGTTFSVHLAASTSEAS